MVTKSAEDFEVQAKSLVDRIERLRATYGMSGEDFIKILSLELHIVWFDAYYQSFIDHQPKSSKKKGAV